MWIICGRHSIYIYLLFTWQQFQSLYYTVYCIIIGWLLNKELERIWTILKWLNLDNKVVNALHIQEQQKFLGYLTLNLPVDYHYGTHASVACHWWWMPPHDHVHSSQQWHLHETWQCSLVTENQVEVPETAGGHQMLCVPILVHLKDKNRRSVGLLSQTNLYIHYPLHYTTC